MTSIIKVYSVLTIIFSPILADNLPGFFLGRRRPKQGNTRVNCMECSNNYALARENFKKDGDIVAMCKNVEQTRRCVQTLFIKSTDCIYDIGVQVLKIGFPHEVQKYNCSSVDLNATQSTLSKSSSMPSMQTKFPPSSVSASTPLPLTNSQLAGLHCRFRPTRTTKLVHCGLFGDPHLKTFWDHRQTCVVEGAWPLINNKYLAVQVTNVQLVDGMSPTATSKITVLIKQQKNGCTEQKVYQAHSGSVPASFRDGTNESGPPACKTRITQEANGTGVQIYICNLNATVLIRQVGKYLTFNIQIPEVFVKDAKGLCSTGCPHTERIDYARFFESSNNIPHVSKKTLKEEEAIALCSRENLIDFYYDSCVFDLMTTGDKQFYDSAFAAMQDAISLDPHLRLRRDNSVVPKPDFNGRIRAGMGATSSEGNSGVRLSPRTLNFCFFCFLLWRLFVT